MLSWIIQISIISLILIFLVHHLIHFFKSTLTVPKIKDLVNSPTQKYENMYNIISNKEYKNTYMVDKIENLLPKQGETTNMKNELKQFLKNQINNPLIESTNISALDSMMSDSFSNFAYIK
uniref:Uncharacterized protein n=1 Tax=viral metagenome TaxID=1070528 RepID=A0A6C0ES85_9ZZZZ